MRRIVGGRRRVTAAGLAVAAAALAAQLPRGDRGGSPHAEAGRESTAGPTAAAPGSVRHAPGNVSRSAGSSAVSAPVRIADAGAVRLLHPGDRVDVIAGPGGAEPARVVARGVRVDRVPRSVETGPAGAADDAADDGALVVLRVPRSTATALAGAGAAGTLAVTLC